MHQARSKKFHHLKRILAKHRDLAHERLHKRHHHLKRILKKHQITIEGIRQKGAQIAATGAVVGAIAASPFSINRTEHAKAEDKNDKTFLDDEKRKLEQKKRVVTKVLSRYGPQKLSSDSKEVDVDIEVASLFKDENALKRIKEIATSLDQSNRGQYEDELTKLFKSYYGIDSAASIDSKRLNTYFGAIGQEQHLPRFAGDNAVSHSDDPVVQKYGITPGRGSWGWWTNSKSSLTQEMIDQEKYYIAAQTFLAPGWRDNTKKLYEWFKYRKILLVNPRNTAAVVAVIADSGPATWTGKNFGGSPEVMLALDAVDGHGIKDIMAGQGGAKDQVFVYFVNDPENKVPLGPVNSEVLLAEK